MKYFKMLTLPIIIIIGIILYNLPIFSSWRYFNYGVTAFNEQKYESAAQSFKKVFDHYDDHILHFNYTISKYSESYNKIKAIRKSGIAPDDSIQAKKINDLANESFEVIENTLNIHMTGMKPNEIGDLYVAKGNLYLLINKIDNAKICFEKAIEYDDDQKQALTRLVEMESAHDSSFVSKLLLSTNESYPIELNTKWNPF